MDEVRRLGFIDSRVLGRWKDESMRMKTDDLFVRSFVHPAPSSIEPGARGRTGGRCAGQWGCAHSRPGLRLVVLKTEAETGKAGSSNNGGC